MCLEDRPWTLLAVAALAAGALLLRGFAPMPTRAAAPTPADTSKVEVLFVGSYHFNPRTAENAVEPDVKDVLESGRQAQVRAVVDSLLRFRPTRVAVEWPHAARDSFNDRYRAYRNGERELSRNEREQLGMRIAARRGHEQVYPVDFRFEEGFSTGLMEAAREHHPEYVEWQRRELGRMKVTMDSLQQRATVLEALRWLNDPETVDRLLDPYMRMTEIVGDSVYPGPEATAQYYHRNLRIFANVTRIAEPGERILVIFGAGHGPFLRSFIEAHPDMELVDPLDYL